MTSKILNTIGLIIGIVGVIFIFIWGPPQPNLNQGISIGLEDATPIDASGKTVAQQNEEIKKENKKYDRNSKIGLVLIMIGFGLQLIAIWLPDRKEQ